MRNLFVLAIVLATAAAFCQTAPPTVNVPQFSISATALPLSGQGSTAPATDVGGELQITNNVYFRSDNILVPAFANTSNYGGINYLLPNSWLKKTKLPQQNLAPYITASLGISRTGANPTNQFAALVGGGMKYCTGNLCVNLAEIRWAHIQGLNNSTVIVSSGLQLGWHW